MTDIHPVPERRSRARTRLRAVAAIVVGAAAVAVPVTIALRSTGKSSDAAPPCTTTVTPTSDIVAAVNGGEADSVVCFTAGTYRISATLSPRMGQTLRGAPGAVLSGAEVVSNWKRQGSLWIAHGELPAAYADGGVCESRTNDDCRLAESLRVDGTVLQRAPDRESLTATTFYADYATNDIYVTTRPAGLAELARTRIAIMSNAPRVTIEGFTVEGFASLYQRSPIMVCGADWVVRNNHVTWNHNVGIQLAKADRARIIDNIVADNGETGISQYLSSGVTIAGNTVAGNNTAGYWISDGQSGGIKLARSSARITDNDIIDNAGVGMWADLYCNDVVITGNRIIGNWADGVRYEISRGGLISDNIVTSNALHLGRGAGTTLFSGGGINLSNAKDVTVSGNDLRANLNAIAVQDRDRTTTLAGGYHLSGIVVRANHIDLRGSTAQVGIVTSSAAPGVTDRSHVRFDSNTYLTGNQSSDEVFVLKSRHLTFEQWQQTGQDRGGELTP